jgi:acetyltransferase EpsM
MKGSRIPLYVFGASGHGRVVAEAASLGAHYDVQGFLDDDPAKKGLRVRNLAVVGGVDVLGKLEPGVHVALGVGANRARMRILQRLSECGAAVTTLVHPSAVVSSGVKLGSGVYVGPLAVVHADATVGGACIINSGAVVEHDSVLEDGVHISPAAALGGNVTVREGAHLGLGVCVLPGLTVGAWSVIGAGAVVVDSIPSGVVAVGVPARVIRTAGSYRRDDE